MTSAHDEGCSAVTSIFFKGLPKALIYVLVEILKVFI